MSYKQLITNGYQASFKQDGINPICLNNKGFLYHNCHRITYLDEKPKTIIIGECNLVCGDIWPTLFGYKEIIKIENIGNHFIYELSENT